MKCALIQGCSKVTLVRERANPAALKSEIRGPKSEGNPKSEIRRPKAEVAKRSGIGSALNTKGSHSLDVFKGLEAAEFDHLAGQAGTVCRFGLQVNSFFQLD